MRLVKLKELAEITSISINSLRKYAKEGMPHYRIGRTIRVDPDEFESWIKANFRREESRQPMDLEMIISNALAKFR
ncbi:MAG: helix-turn-helix domain-containing protein [Desulfatibacillum sp.]|nr:helix-turn-helix domain-containing protein [Desulfatibacillum sp.]